MHAQSADGVLVGQLVDQCLKALAICGCGALSPAFCPSLKPWVAGLSHEHDDLQRVLQIDPRDLEERHIDRAQTAGADGAPKDAEWAALRGHPSTVANRCSPPKCGKMPAVASIYYLISALERGDCEAAWAYAARMPRGRVTLDHALGLVALLSLDDPPVEHYEAAVDRWIERAKFEHPHVPIERLRSLLDWLPDLPAVAELQTLCEQQAWPVALATLEHLLPRG